MLTHHSDGVDAGIDEIEMRLRVNNTWTFTCTQTEQSSPSSVPHAQVPRSVVGGEQAELDEARDLARQQPRRAQLGVAHRERGRRRRSSSVWRTLEVRYGHANSNDTAPESLLLPLGVPRG